MLTQVGFLTEVTAKRDRETGFTVLVNSLNSGYMFSIVLFNRFQRELVNLKVTADYSSYDPTKIDPWLMSVVPELSQYTYAMLRNGMDRNLLSSTTDEELKDVCGIVNGIHRRIILQHLSGEFAVTYAVYVTKFNTNRYNTDMSCILIYYYRCYLICFSICSTGNILTT